jgi:hypothetical protein
VLEFVAYRELLELEAVRSRLAEIAAVGNVTIGI